MTWNIHGARPLLGRSDLKRVIAFVQRHAPDVVALQEVDARLCGARAFDDLADGLGRFRAEARVLAAPEGDYGHVVLTRWPILQWAKHDISVARREPRAALEAMIDTPAGRLHIVAVHLGLSMRERHRQARRLAALATSTTAPTVLLGDFNDWFWHGSVQWALREIMPGRTRIRTFPASLPVFRLDRIYCRPARILHRVFTDLDAKAASDHLPVIADICLADQPAPPASHEVLTRT